MNMDFTIYARKIACLYRKILTEVSAKFELTQMELDVLLFLQNNPENDTAKDIVEIRKLTKSHVSAAVESLVRKNYLERVYYPDNRKLIHLKIRAEADEILKAGLSAQEEFRKILEKNISDSQKAEFFKVAEQIEKNIEEAEEKLGRE